MNSTRRGNKVRQWYDSIAKEYKEHYSHKIDELYYDSLYVKYFYQMADLKNKKVLDLGCGTGRLMERFIAYTDYVIGIDFSIEMLKEAYKTKQQCTKLIQMDARNLGFKSSIFDVVISKGPIAESGDIIKMFLEVSRILNPGGIFIFSIRNDVFYTSIYRRLLKFKKGLERNRKARYFEPKEYTLYAIKNYLRKANLHFNSYCSTYFFPLEIINKFHYRFPEGRMSEWLFRIVTGLTDFFNKCGITRRFGSVYIISALK